MHLEQHTIRRKPGHPDYNASVKEILDDLEAEFSEISEAAAAELLLNLSDSLRIIVKSRPHPLAFAIPPVFQAVCGAGRHRDAAFQEVEYGLDQDHLLAA